MDVTAREIAAVATVDGQLAEVLPAEPGRLVVTPHPLIIEGQTNVPVDLQPGESLAAFLDRHVPGIASGAWAVSIGGAVVPQAMWAYTYPKQGQLIAARCVLRRQVLSLVAIAALTWFSGGIAASIYGAAGGTFVAASAGLALSAIQAGVVLAGSMLINKVMAPKVPSLGSAAAPKTLYSLTSQRNSARPYEPMGVLLGVMRVTPDLAAQPYTWNAGDDQYLATQLLGGINVHRVTDLAVGDTPLSNYSEATAFFSGFSGMPDEAVPLHGNTDTIAGGQLGWEGDNPWITRTSSGGAVALAVDIEGRLYDSDPGSKTGLGPNGTTITLEYRLVGAQAWTPWRAEAITNRTTDTLRYTWQIDVPPGRYEVRARLAAPTWNDDGDVCEFAWTALKTFQSDTTNYAGKGRIGIRIKASGQLSGSLDTVRATFHPRPLPVWTPGGWVQAQTLEEGACNPGALVLQVLRGIYAPDGSLQFGMGLSDDQIDIEGLKAFMLHCTARGYTYSKWVTQAVSVGAILEEISLAGMGQYTWVDGSRPTVAWAASGQPISGVVNMANMLRGSFQVTYNLAQAADGIEYSYVDRNTWETTTLRVAAPGVASPINPARLTGEGITTAAHAAVMARYHLAQSLYQYKTVAFGADIEHLDYRRMAMLSISHDMTQWGFGGRLIGAEILAGKVVLTLDEPVPALAAFFVGLRVPGDRDYRVFQVEAFAGETDRITLVGAWPEGVAFPGAAEDNPAHDTLWCFDFKATPGLRVRVVSITPQGDLQGADVVAVPESAAFWDYVYNGTYVPAPNDSSLPELARPKVSNLQVTERINAQGNTEWAELSLTWNTTGACDHCQVWAALDGQQLRLVDAQAQGNRSVFRIDQAGLWLIEVRPFDASGRLGELAYTLHGTAAVDLPPRNVDTFAVQQVAGELRRFIWTYGATPRPGNLAGVQIRYAPGAVNLSVADWDNLTPIAGPGDIYTGELETTRPDAGTWTFACRAINTAGLLANGVRTHTITLQAPFAGMKEDIDQLTNGLDETVELITGGTPVAQLPALPLPLAQLAAAQHTAQAAMGSELADAAQQLLRGVLAYQGLQERMSAAGVYVDQATGTVRIYGVDANTDHINALQILVDAVRGQLSLKATTQYVDDKIAQAALGEADLALFQGMDARISVVEVGLDSVSGLLQLKASTASVQDLTGRVSVAEQTLNTQAGLIEQKVSTGTFEAANGAINGRLSSAEEQLEALGDTAGIRQSVVVARQAQIAASEVAGGLLRNVIATWEANKAARAEAAGASNDLRVRIEDGLLAEATRRQELFAAMQTADAQLTAQVRDEATARTTAIGAQATRLDALTAAFESESANLSAALGSESLARAGADAAEVTLRQALSTKLTGLANPAGATLGGLTSGLLAEERNARTTADTSQVQQLTALTATVGGNQASVQASLQALSGTQSAQAGQLTALTATVGGNSASITQQAQALVSLDGRFSASVGLRLDVNGRVSGWVANNNGSQSDFVILGDRFALARQGDGGLRYPFVVGQVNGVDSAAVNGNLLVDGSVRANSIFVDTLSAITGRMGYLSSGQLDITSNGGNDWGFVRSAGKWIGDGVDGFGMARHPNGDVWAELKAGVSRLAMHKGAGYFRLEGPWGWLGNDGMQLNQLNVIGTAQIQGNAISVIRSVPGRQYEAGAQQQRLVIENYDPGGADVVATISCGCIGRFTVEVWRNGSRLAWETVTGSTQFVLPAHQGSQEYSAYIEPQSWQQQNQGSSWHNVFTLMSFKR